MKKRFNKRLIGLSVCVVLVLGLLLPVSLGLVGCAGKAPNYDGMKINFKDYKSLGVASVQKGKKSTSRKYFLVGEKTEEDNEDTTDMSEIEQVTFDNNGKLVHQTMNVRQILYLEKYTIVQFSKKEIEDIYAMGFMDNNFHTNTNGLYTFLVRNETGKIYSLGRTGLGWFYFSQDYDGGDTIYAHAAKASVNRIGPRNDYKMSIGADNRLKIEQVTNDVYNISMADKFGNLFLTDGVNYYIKKAVNPNGALTRLNIEIGADRFGRVLNGRVYVSDTEYYNQSGELETGDPVSFIQHSGGYKVIKIDDEGFEYRMYLMGGSMAFVSTYKYKYIDEYHFVAEKVYYPEWSKERNAIMGTNLYYIENYRIVYLNLLESETIAGGQIESDLLFTSIKLYRPTGEIEFTATDLYQNKITGLIKSDGTVTTTISAPDFAVLYLQPIN